MEKFTLYQYIQHRLNGARGCGIVAYLLDDIERDKEVQEGMSGQDIINHIRWHGEGCHNTLKAITFLVKNYRLYCKQNNKEREEITLRYVGGFIKAV